MDTCAVRVHVMCLCDIYMHVCRLLQDIRYKSIYLDHLVTIWLWKHGHEICLVVSLCAHICVCWCDWLASKQQSDLRLLWHIHGLWCVSTTYRMTAYPERAVKYWKFVPDHRLQGSESAQAKIYSSQGCITRSVRDMALKPFCLSLAQIPQECAFVRSCQCVTVSVWVCAYQGMMCIHYWKCSLCLKRIHTGSLHHHNTPSPAKLGSAEMLRKKKKEDDIQKQR